MRRKLYLDRAPKARDSTITAVITQDVEPILDRNKALQNEPQRSDWGRHVASIPNVVLQMWLNDEHRRGNTSLRLFTPEMDAIIARKLNDPDWRWLRTG